jgi:Omp85 superfamily domain
LKTLAFFLLFLSFWTPAVAQNFQLKIIGNTTAETKVIDSIQYNSFHANAKAIADEISDLSERLSKLGYIENQVLENTKKNDSTYGAKFNLGTQIKSIHIYIGRKILSPTFSKGEGAEEGNHNNSTIIDLIGLDKSKDSLILPYAEVETFLNTSLQKLEQKGYAFAKLKLINIEKKKDVLFAELAFNSGRQRELDEIVVQFGESSKTKQFPEGHLKQINRKYRNTVLNQETVRKVRNDFEKFSFVNQIKSPEILFTQDTTKVYVYLEKRKSNTFDGFIGFANNTDGTLTFNGYLDLVLENTIKAGEQFALYWKSDGNNQRTFKASIDLPYIFRSPIGLKAQINIFKQDSIFQNTKTAIDLGYFIDYKTRIYLGYQSTSSSDIQNTNSSTISDYSNSFLTGNLDYSKSDNSNTTFPKKTILSIMMGLGSRATTDLATTAGTSQQTYIIINAMHNFYWNPKNCININYQNYFLKSDTYIINELYRFGGTKSIRGFAENSLQANFMTALITEYRYIISPDLYLHSILDYGYYEDQSSNYKANLLGFGLGVGLRTKNGVLKLNFSNGSNDGQKVLFSNTIVTLNYNIEF